MIIVYFRQLCLYVHQSGITGQLHLQVFPIGQRGPLCNERNICWCRGSPIHLVQALMLN